MNSISMKLTLNFIKRLKATIYAKRTAISYNSKLW